MSVFRHTRQGLVRIYYAAKYYIIRMNWLNPTGVNMFKKHVFVCTEGKTCPTQGAGEVLAQLRQALAADPIHNETMRINKAGCLSQCGNGPMVVIYPEGVWYCQVSPNDCKEIVEEHLSKNQVIQRLLYDEKNKAN